mmetsp:Transcript_10245/g.19473  ORF Transcript_10245/g.19473 Transcript_10245/m.19473 type:complete len:208 (-) Transcript_10245:125-748(-)
MSGAYSRSRLVTWGATKVRASWFPWFLGSLSFLDYFCLVGFAVPPLQGVAFTAVSARRATLICCLCAGGAFLGSWCFALLLGHFDILAGRINPDHAQQASELLRNWGALAGLVNGLCPMPGIPLIVAAVTLELERFRLLLVLTLLALGRLLRYGATAAAVFASKAAINTRAGARAKVVTENTNKMPEDRGQRHPKTRQGKILEARRA